MNLRIDHRNGWGLRHVLASVAFVAFAVLATSDVWRDIYRLSSGDEEASHVFLVPFAVAWLVWVRRARLRQCRPVGRILGTLLIGAGWLLWSIGYRHNVQSFWHGGAVLIAVGALLTVLGKDVFFKFLPAFVVLVFIVPVPSILRQRIAIPLQEVTAQVTQHIGELIGMSIARRGNSLSVNGIDITIVEACNGMRMVFTLFMACYLFAFTTPLRGYVRAIVLLASPATAIVANVLRLVPTVWMYGYTSQTTASQFHDISGWVMLVAAFLALTGIVRTLRWADVPVSPYPLGLSV